MFISSRRPSAIAAGLLAIAAAATACSGGAGASGAAVGPPPEKSAITVCDFPTIDSAGLFIAKMKGYFRQQGLAVTVRYEPFSQHAVADQESGKCDISSADYVTYVDDEVTRNARLKIIAEASFLRPHQIGLLVSPRFSLGSVSDLQGKTVAVSGKGDIATLLVDSLLAEHGVPPASVHLMPGVPLNNAPAVLHAGQYAAAPVPEPFLTEGEQKYGLTELADMDQGGATNFPIQGFAVTASWAARYPNTLRAFTTALDAGQEKADTDRGLVEEVVENFLLIKPETAALIALPSYPIGVDDARLQRVPDAMVRFGLLPEKDANFNISSMIATPSAGS
jgi:NitT/TauT family transport system substrate-binding protein